MGSRQILAMMKVYRLCHQNKSGKTWINRYWWTPELFAEATPFMPINYPLRVQQFILPTLQGYFCHHFIDCCLVDYIWCTQKKMQELSARVSLSSVYPGGIQFFLFFLNLFYYMTPHKCAGKKTTYQCWTALSTMNTLGIYLKSSDLATRTFTDWAILLAPLFCFVMLSSSLYFSDCVTDCTIFISYDQGSLWSSEISVTSVPKRVKDKILPRE